VNDESPDDPDNKKSYEVRHHASSGLYVYDIGKTLNGKIEKYKLAMAIGGVCNHVDNSLFSNRFSFIQDYNNLVVLPFPHLNLINCVGMG